MTALREVALHQSAVGRLFLHSMPGRNEPLAEVWQQVQAQGITAIVNLAPAEEVQKKSPEYAKAIATETIPCEVWPLPVPDFAAPTDDASFSQLAHRVAAALRAGQAILIHCGAGIGRTGTVAVAALLALGSPIGEARRLVRAAGSGPEVPGQEAALERFEAALKSEPTK